MSLVTRTIQQFVKDSPSVKRWWVAFSGGLDSSVLLRALVEAAPEQPIMAVHVNHGLSDYAGDWQAHCQAVCDELSVALVCQSVVVNNTGRGLEDAARHARYSVFEQLLVEGDVLLAGHHLDDQAETLLLRLMRGSGVRGLAAMADCRPVGAGVMHRPLLGVARDTLERQAGDWSMRWVEDDSNASSEFDRNYLRNAVLPAIRERWPDFAEQWQRSASWCRQADELVEEVAAEDLSRLDEQPETVGVSIDLEGLRRLSAYRQGNVIRGWIEREGLEAPEFAHIEQLQAQVIAGRDDSQAQVQWGRVRLRRFRRRLYLLPVSLERSTPPSEPVHWRGNEVLAWGDWRLRLVEVADGGFRLPPGGFEVAARRGGERCQPAHRQHSQTLKKLLLEAAVPPWLRDQLPLLSCDGEIAAVGDLWVCRGWLAGAAPGYRLDWQFSPP